MSSKRPPTIVDDPGNLGSTLEGPAAAAVQEFLRGQEYERQGRSSDAEKTYRQLLQSFPQHPAMLLALADLLRRRGVTSEAEDLLRRAIDAEPREPTAHTLLGAVLRSAGRLEEAATSHRRALALRPDSPDAHYNLGLVLELQEQYDEAMREFELALRAKRDFEPALVHLGVIAQGKGELDTALQYLDRAVTARPQSFQAHYHRGSVLSRLKRWDEALTSLAHATRIRTDSTEALLATANALRDAGRNDEALTAYWKAMEQRPEHAPIHLELNRLAWAAGRADLFLRSFAYAREKLGERVELLNLEGQLEVRREGFVAAEKLLHRAATLAPDRGDIAGMLARAVAGQRRFLESIPLFESAIRLDPGQPAHRQEFGFALLRARQPTEAQQVFLALLQQNPVDQTALAGIALCYRTLGNSTAYAQLVDLERFVGVYDLPVPRRFAGPGAWGEALAGELDALHTTRVEPIEQSLRGGTQTTGDLFGERSAAVQELREAVDAAVRDYFARLPIGAAERAGGVFDYTGSWSCRLAAGGHHRNHVHPQGRLSSAYYVRLPDSLDDEAQRPGWLKFGESAHALGPDDRPERYVKPVPGRLVLFPSCYWHGTVPFAGGGDRLTVAFDVVPRVVGS